MWYCLCARYAVVSISFCSRIQPNSIGCTFGLRETVSSYCCQHMVASQLLLELEAYLADHIVENTFIKIIKLKNQMMLVMLKLILKIEFAKHSVGIVTSRFTRVITTITTKSWFTHPIRRPLSGVTNACPLCQTHYKAIEII